MNKVILLGRLTKKPEIRYSQTNDLKVANFTIAVDRQYVKKGEERQTDFINIIAFSKIADFVEKYLEKGLQICLSGRIQNRVWTDDNNIKHYITEIIAEEINFADSRKNNEENNLNTTISDNLVSQEDTDNEIISSGDDDFPF